MNEYWVDSGETCHQEDKVNFYKAINKKQRRFKMSNITLNTERIYEKGSTSKYWRDVKCLPQTVSLSTWASNSPLFILEGVIVNSHDKKEIGTAEKVYVQTYDFWLKEDIEKGIYSIKK